MARRCEELAKLAESFKESLYRDLEMALAKIPTRIRNMTLKEFDQAYGPEAKSEIVPQTGNQLSPWYFSFFLEWMRREMVALRCRSCQQRCPHSSHMPQGR